MTPSPASSHTPCEAGAGTMTITIVTRPSNSMVRAWVHDGTRWMRPHETVMTLEAEPTETTPNILATYKSHRTLLHTTTVTWQYNDDRTGGTFSSNRQLELETRGPVNIWTLNP